MLIDTRTRLEHILQAARKAVSYTEGHTRAELDTDEPLAVTIIHFCALAGEAAKKVERNFQNAHPEVPWKELADLRNKLFHEYYAVDLDIVWHAAVIDLPGVIDSLENLLAGEII